MSLSGSSSSTGLVQLDFTFDPDPARFRRLANLLFSPATITGSTVGVSS